MPETLLSPSNLLLFGRIVEDLQVVEPADPRHGPFVGPRTGVNRSLENQLTGPDAGFARIYGFSYGGAYYELDAPTLFLVHGLGEDAETGPEPGSRVSRAPDDTDRSGLAAQDFSYADNLRVWSYDSADFSIRLDMESGTFEQILLDIMGDGDGAAVSGARVSGARVSGARVSGARVSGARVSGARVSGARVSGARVKGARVGGDD